MISVLFALLLSQDGQSNEPVLRETFSREFKDPSPAKRVEALKKLRDLHQEKTLAMLAEALRDPSVEVRKAAAEVIATCTDVHGAAVKGLCAALKNRKEAREVRSACAKALQTAPLKAEAIDALVQAIQGDVEKDLFAASIDSLNYLAAQDFGAGKEAASKWKSWWTEQKPRLLKEDREKLASLRKPDPVKSR